MGPVSIVTVCLYRSTQDASRFYSTPSPATAAASRCWRPLCADDRLNAVPSARSVGLLPPAVQQTCRRAAPNQATPQPAPGRYEIVVRRCCSHLLGPTAKLSLLPGSSDEVLSTYELLCKSMDS